MYPQISFICLIHFVTTFTVWLINDQQYSNSQEEGVKVTTSFGYLLSCTWIHFSPILGCSPRQGWFSRTLLGTYLWRHTIWRLSPPSWILLKSAETERERRRGRETWLIKENSGTFTGHREYTNWPKSKNLGDFYWGWMGREHMLSMVKKVGGGQGKKCAVYV